LEKQSKSGCKGCTLEELENYKIIHRDKEKSGFILNYAMDPEVDGHLVVQPTFHAEQLSDLCEDQAERLMRIIWACCKTLEELFPSSKVYVYSLNEKKDYHFHVHIKPKHENVAVKGPCFVNWKDPEIEKMAKTSAKSHFEEIVKRIKDNKYMRRLG